ncbi:MAG: dolichol kinase [Thermofilum sp.]|uniref:dolichol kinase n=1 Tax=Thermofilum sp. TaxID=1961369 RepID=UPI002582A081|nr:dolichol kinase [Thermofilum sp.]MCI4409665.1 dolichol kinase [Thermofilum sp.]
MVTTSEILWTLGLFAWVMFVVTVIAKATYNFFVKRGNPQRVAIYYARKVIHILAGGAVSVIIAYLPIFSSPLMPFIMALVLALLTYLPHKTGKLMYWFQDPENIYEVDFCIAWGIFTALGWYAGKQLGFQNPFLFPALPLLIMAVGDGVTGIVRNKLFKRRVKHWSGNLAMFIVSAAMAIVMGFGIPGILSALLGSIVEKVEYIGKIRLDDNVTVPTVSFLTLYALMLLRPTP